MIFRWLRRQTCDDRTVLKPNGDPSLDRDVATFLRDEVGAVDSEKSRERDGFSSISVPRKAFRAKILKDPLLARTMSTWSCTMQDIHTGRSLRVGPLMTAPVYVKHVQSVGITDHDGGVVPPGQTIERIKSKLEGMKNPMLILLLLSMVSYSVYGGYRLYKVASDLVKTQAQLNEDISSGNEQRLEAAVQRKGGLQPHSRPAEPPSPSHATASESRSGKGE